MLALSIIAIVLASLSFIGVVSLWIYLVQVRKRFLIRAREQVNQGGQGQPARGIEGETTLREIRGFKS
jgi:hypothetical protein